MIYQQKILLFSTLNIFIFAAPEYGWRSEPELLSTVQQAVYERRNVDGTHEICSQGSQRFRSSRSATFISSFQDSTFNFIVAKRRSANHPCPVCGKFYVNEGSLRKHLACHPEMTSQLASSLRMWPCSVCTAVFTHENGE